MSWSRRVLLICGIVAGVAGGTAIGVGVLRRDAADRSAALPVVPLALSNVQPAGSSAGPEGEDRVELERPESAAQRPSPPEPAGVRVRGRLVDQDGRAVEASLRIRRASEPPQEQWFAGDPFVAQARSDREGRFVFDALATGSWQIAPVGEADVAPIPQLVQIGADAAEVEVTVLAYRGFSISGEVLDPEGRPAAGVDIVASSPGERGTWVRSRSDASGRFVLAPIGPEEHSVGSLGRASSVVSARPGDRDVIVRLEPAGALRGVVLDASTGAPAAASVRISSLEGPKFSTVVQAGRDGVFSAENLRPGRWRIEAETPTQRGWLPELAVRDREVVENLTLRLEPAAVLEIASEIRYAWLSAVDAQGRTFCELRAEAPVSRCVVEPGRWIVREYDPAQDVTRELEVSLRRGEQRRVDFGLLPR